MKSTDGFATQTRNYVVLSQPFLLDW